VSFIRLWWVRYKFLAFRNPLNYFQYRHLGFYVNYYPAHYTILELEGDPDVSEDNLGVYYVLIREPKTGVKYYTYYRVSVCVCL